jgi:hypothetical protein
VEEAVLHEGRLLRAANVRAVLLPSTGLRPEDTESERARSSMRIPRIVPYPFASAVTTAARNTMIALPRVHRTVHKVHPGK